MTNVEQDTDVLAATIDVDGLDVLDVGCGAGDLVRWMRQRGASVVGAECGADMRARAIAADPDHQADYIDAGGQSLPFEDRSFDLVVYSYSLHHVAIDDIPAALAEARRVLRDGGMLYVVEPEPLSPDNAVAYPVVDERVELAAAQEALDRTTSIGFTNQEARSYVSAGTYETFEGWIDTMVGVDPDRAAAVNDHLEQLREQFHRIGSKGPDGFTFRRGNIVRVLNASSTAP